MFSSNEIIQIFFSCPMNYIPVIDENSIKGFISRKKVTKELSSHVFRDQKFDFDFISDVLLDKTYKLSDFFCHLDQYQTKEIHTIDQFSSQIKKISIETFSKKLSINRISRKA